MDGGVPEPVRDHQAVLPANRIVSRGRRCQEADSPTSISFTRKSHPRCVQGPRAGSAGRRDEGVVVTGQDQGGVSERYQKLEFPQVVCIWRRPRPPDGYWALFEMPDFDGPRTGEGKNDDPVRQRQS